MKKQNLINNCRNCKNKIITCKSIDKQFCNLDCYNEWKPGNRTNTGKTHFKTGEKNYKEGFWKLRKTPFKIIAQQIKETRLERNNYKHSLETRKRISIAQRGINISQFNGFIRVQKYSIEFFRLRDFIKERDNYRCQYCGDNKSRLDIHHIDYNKDNNFINNLITLCASCHSKTNYKREEWKKEFILINERRLGNK